MTTAQQIEYAIAQRLRELSLTLNSQRPESVQILVRLHKDGGRIKTVNVKAEYEFSRD